jgi:uncharacterized protein YciI
MPVYAVTYRYTDDSETRSAVRPTHREYLRGLAERGALLVSGPYAPSEPAGALLLFRGATKEEVLGFTEQDPFRLQGLIADVSAVEWVPASGALAPQFAE